MPVTALQIIKSIPERFRAEKAHEQKLVVHFDISGGETLQYTVTVENGTCNLQQGFAGKPDCIIKTKAATYIDLETGKGNAQMALMLGKIKISNLSVMIQFVKCFRKFQDAAAESVHTALSDMAALPVLPVKQGPLAQVKIIDFTRLLPGPLATMFLADMGAEVIKVEDPDNPDYIRDFEPRVNGVSMFYLALNRSKLSLAVNYFSEGGRQIIYDLIKTADVFIEQFRPGVMQELGFGYEELSKINPKLIYVSVSGYGQHSAKAHAAGHDLNYIATAGALGITGTASEVTIPGFQLADIAGGSYMAMNAVMAALFQRERTGKGEWVDVSMTDAAVPFSALQFAYHQGAKMSVGRGQFELSGGLANYNVYKCLDGKFIALGSLEPKFWNKFCEKVGKPGWQEQFLSKGEALQVLKNEVRDLFLQKNRADWLQEFKDTDFCFSAVNELSEIEHDALLQERNMFVENEFEAVGKFKTINQPLKFLNTPFNNNSNAPKLGEHTLQILSQLGYTKEKLSGHLSAGVIKQA